MSRKLAAALAITAVLAIAPAAQAGRTVPIGPLNNQAGADVTFAEGSEATPDNDILVNLGGLIDRAPTGSTIVGAMYRITDNGRIETDLREAAGRDVELWLVHDNPTTIFNDWKSDEKAHLHFKQCLLGCLSATPGGPGNDPAESIQHMKYFTFSRTQRYPGGAFSAAAWVGSANLDVNTGTNAWNNAVGIFGDTGLNAGLERVFRDQWNGAAGRWGPNFDYYTWPNPNPAGTEGNGAFVAPISGTAGIFSPEQQTDLWETQLRMLKGPDEGGAQDCRIAVFHNYLEDVRMAAIDELARLSFYGCQVRVVVNFVDNDPPEYDFVNMGGEAKDALCNTPGDLRVIAVRKMHSKAIAAYGTFNGAYRATVWTGSHNLTANALKRNDEMILRLDNAPKLADEFMNEYSLAYLHTARDVCTAPAP